MANMLDYLRGQGDRTMAVQPFNPVDALILAWLANLPLDGLVPGTLGDAAAALSGEELSENNRSFVELLEKSLRFRELPLLRFENQFDPAEEKQFAALLTRTEDGRLLTAFRGTDSTLVGWKENLNLAFSEEVPAQREAARFLNEAMALDDAPVRVVGHSKGGNLAVWAAAKREDQERISSVFNFDGPGVLPQMRCSEGYRNIALRVQTYLPECAVVGTLLDNVEDYFVVQSDAAGLLQHDPFTWQTTQDGFVLLPSLSWGSLYADRTIGSWLERMSLTERRAFVEALYDLVQATGAETVGEIGENRRQSIWAILNAYSELSLRTKLMLFTALIKLVQSAVQNREKREEKHAASVL